MSILGQTIKKIRPLTHEECDLFGFDPYYMRNRPNVLELDDGTVIVPSRDHELNAAGVLHRVTEGKIYDI